jgi:hypothetical protein
MASISDMNLQHPELIPLLIATEPKLKENEWIEVRGLMSRVSTPPIGVIFELLTYAYSRARWVIEFLTKGYKIR